MKYRVKSWKEIRREAKGWKKSCSLGWEWCWENLFLHEINGKHDVIWSLSVTSRSMSDKSESWLRNLWNMNKWVDCETKLLFQESRVFRLSPQLAGDTWKKLGKKESINWVLWLYIITDCFTAPYELAFDKHIRTNITAAKPHLSDFQGTKLFPPVLLRFYLYRIF